MEVLLTVDGSEFKGFRTGTRGTAQAQLVS
jgi:hypothetical protein